MNTNLIDPLSDPHEDRYLQELLASKVATTSWRPSSPLTIAPP